MTEETINYVKDKKIIDFKEGETIYIKKLSEGFDWNFFCEFISFEKGLVKAKIISCGEDRSWYPKGMEIGDIITARPHKCYLYGNDGRLKWNHCVWFNKQGELK